MVRNLNNKEIANFEEFQIIYSGSSFTNRFKINELSLQLKATDDLVRACFEVLKEQKKVQINNDIKDIYLEVKRGSFAEHIVVLLNNEEVRGYIINLIFFLINLYLTQNTDKKIEALRKEVIPLIKKGTSKSLLNMIEPLKLNDDCVKIEYETKEVITIHKHQVPFIVERIKEEESNIDIEVKIETLIGRLSSLNIDTHRFGFYLNKFSRIFPIKVDLSLDDMKYLLGKKLSLEVKVHYKLDEPVRVDLLRYSIIQDKKISDF